MQRQINHCYYYKRAWARLISAGFSVLVLSVISFSVFFSTPNLRDRSVNCHQFLHAFDDDMDLYNWVRNLGTPSPKNLAAQNIKIWDKLRATSQLDREYLRNETRYRRTENGVPNCNLSCCVHGNKCGELWSTNENRTRVSTDLTRSRRVGHVS